MSTKLKLKRALSAIDDAKTGLERAKREVEDSTTADEGSDVKNPNTNENYSR